jgi:hypothetical protein
MHKRKRITARTGITGTITEWRCQKLDTWRPFLTCIPPRMTYFYTLLPFPILCGPDKGTSRLSTLFLGFSRFLSIRTAPCFCRSFPFNPPAHSSRSILLFTLPVQSSCSLFLFNPPGNSSCSILLLTLPVQSPCSLFPFNPPVHSSCSLFLFTLPVQSSCSLFLFNPPVHSSCSILLFTLPVHSSCSILLFTLPVQSSYSLFLFTLPVQSSCSLFLFTLYAHCPCSFAPRFVSYPTFPSATPLQHNQSRQGLEYNPSRPPRPRFSVILHSCDARARLYFQRVTTRHPPILQPKWFPLTVSNHIRGTLHPIWSQPF